MPTDAGGINVVPCTSEVTSAECMMDQKCGLACNSGGCAVTPPSVMGCMDADMDGMVDGTCEAVLSCQSAGMQAPGQNCTQTTAATDTDIDTDDCARGATCVEFGMGAAAKRICMKWCDSSMDCANLTTGAAMTSGFGSKCFTDGFFRLTNVNACTQPCKLADTPNPCPTGFVCKILISQASQLCWPSGTIGLGLTCEGQGTAGCAGQASCAREDPNDGTSPAFCRKNCDMDLPCPMTFTCRAIANAPNGSGTCQPI
jgi:hypothetical protein